MNTNEELKTRPDNPDKEHFDGMLLKELAWKLDREVWAHVQNPSPSEEWSTSKAREETRRLIKEYIGDYDKIRTTHVEPLQAKLDKSESENQKLRDLLKDAHETLIIASLIDKSNTCRDSAARIDAFLKTKTNP